jgi:biopolymer transport protein ExbB
MWMRLAVCAAAAMGCRYGFDGDGTVLTTPPRSTLLVGPQLSTTLADFTLPVVLDDTRADRTAMAADGSDLRFYDGDGNLLAHEIAQLGTPGGAPLIAWVRVPSLAPSSEIQVDYGRATTPPASAASPWSADVAAVYHFEESAGSPRDATTTHHDTVATGTTTAAGQCGAGRRFVALSKDVLVIADAPSLALPNFTASGWLYENALPPPGLYHALVTREYATTGFNDFWLGDYAGLYYAALDTTTDGSFNFTATPATAGTWVHLALTVDGTITRLYVNGVERAARAVTGPVVHSLRPILIGADAGVGAAADADFLDGLVDEVKIESAVRDPTWIQIDDLAMRDQLLQYGPVAP